MNDQLQATIEALQGDITTLDQQAALENVSGWIQALSGVPGAEEVVTALGTLEGALAEGDTQMALGALPVLGMRVQSLAPGAPEADQAGLMRLAELLQR